MLLFLDGLRLMVMGMGMVFSFLLIMIFCMNLMAKVLAPFAKLEAAPAAKPAAKKASQSDADIAAAAVAAVEHFRK